MSYQHSIPPLMILLLFNLSSSFSPSRTADHPVCRNRNIQRCENNQTEPEPIRDIIAGADAMVLMMLRAQQCCVRAWWTLARASGGGLAILNEVVNAVMRLRKKVKRLCVSKDDEVGHCLPLDLRVCSTSSSTRESEMQNMTSFTCTLCWCCLSFVSQNHGRIMIKPDSTLC
jgi:hypothetical protein